jgi:hypothetical protein
VRALVALAAAIALAVPVAASAAPTPVAWCGNGEVPASRQPDLQLGSARQIHVIYALPADAPDDFASVASGIATDVAAIDAFWRRQDPIRTPRFDLFPFVGCGSTFGDLDLGFVRLPGTEAAYEQSASVNALTFALTRDLGSVLGPDEKSLVYFNGRAPEGDVCGISRGDPTGGGLGGVSIIFLRSDCDELPIGSGVSATIAAHELTHNLGAVPEEAPHTNIDVCAENPGHVCDSTADLLYPFLTPGFNLDVAQLDVGHDDYYGHSGSWWDVQDSDWLAHLPQYVLTVTASSGGSVSLADGKELHVDCKPTCSGFLDDDVSLQATPTPAKGFLFAGWSGACTGLTACTISNIAGPTNVAARFTLSPRRVTVRISGRGRVTSSPNGISCPGTCGHDFAADSGVRLIATPAKGWRFVGWTGACNGLGACTFHADRARLASARFAKR